MLDRVMRSMNRYFDDGQHLHGEAGACDRHCRAWALLHNFRPWNPATARANDGWRSPAERLNEHRYHDDWLQNLLSPPPWADSAAESARPKLRDGQQSRGRLRYTLWTSGCPW